MGDAGDGCYFRRVDDVPEAAKAGSANAKGRGRKVRRGDQKTSSGRGHGPSRECGEGIGRGNARPRGGSGRVDPRHHPGKSGTENSGVERGCRHQEGAPADLPPQRAAAGRPRVPSVHRIGPLPAGYQDRRQGLQRARQQGGVPRGTFQNRQGGGAGGP